MLLVVTPLPPWRRLIGLDAEASLRTELLAGLTTFLTMAYIAFVNPQILSAAGLDQGSVFVATCAAAAVGCTFMAVFARYPIALAPGMGLNAYFTYGLVLGEGVPAATALGVVFVAGLIFLGLSITPAREWLIEAIPRCLRLAIAAGIGLFLALLGMQHGGLVVDHPQTLVALGDLSRPEPLLSAGGFVLIAALDHRRVPGAILIGVLAVTLVAVVFGVAPFGGVVAMPPSLAPTFLLMDVGAALDLTLVAAIAAFLLVDLFDTAGTLVGVTHGSPLVDEDGRLPRMGRALLADSAATVVGACLGTSTVTSYIESASGMRAGGRTGLTALVVAALFGACLFLAPLAGTVPACATAPALIYVAVLMAPSLVEVDWADITEAAPVLACVLGIPLTFSIASGIGFGLLSWVAIKVLAGRPREVGIGPLVLAALFVLKFALAGQG